MQQFKTKYSERTRVSPENHIWLRNNKGRSETSAAFLDKIINHYKQHHGL